MKPSWRCYLADVLVARDVWMEDNDITQGVYLINIETKLTTTTSFKILNCIEQQLHEDELL